MSHYAKIENNCVVEVINAEQDHINTLPGQWVQTSYRTMNNQHPENRPMRGNFAGIGYHYDTARDVFYPPQPFPSWTMDWTICNWVPPTPYPENAERCHWDEDSQSWITEYN